MNYPFIDTSANRRLATLIDRSMGEATHTRHDVGDYIVHVYPHRIIRLNPQIDDLDTYTSRAHIGVIDKRTGHFGLNLFKNNVEHDDHFGSREVVSRVQTDRTLDVDSVLETLAEGDGTQLLARFPHLVNLGEDRHTYLDLYIELKEYETVTNPTEASVNWLLTHARVPTGQGDPPPEVQAIIEARINQFPSDGNDPEDWFLKARKMRMAYIGVNTLGKRIPHEYDTTNILAVQPYTREGANKDAARIAERLSPVDVPAIQLDIPEEDYSEGLLALEARFEAQQQTAVNAFVEGLEADHRAVVLARHLEAGSAMDPSDIEANVARLFDIGASRSEVLERLMSVTPEGLRNNLQIFDRLGGDRSTYLAFTEDKRIADGVEAGRPMKDVLAHLPLVNLSKKTINNFLENFRAFVQPEAGSVPTFHLEKGPAQCHRSLNQMHYHATRHEAAALLSSLPERPFQRGKERSADGMVDIMVRYPFAMDCMAARLMAARKGESSLRDAFSWVPGELAEENERYRQVEDGGRVLHSVFYTAILCHLHSRNEAEDERMRMIFVAQVERNEMMKALAQTGEYRHLLRAEEQAHKRINDFYKRGKPDSSLEWNPATERFQLGEYTIEPITDNASLTLEGSELNHCVGSYLRTVMANESFIFSVKHQGQRVSTLELKGDSLDNLRVEQHRAFANGTPQAGAQAAVEAFVGAILAGEIDFDFAPCADLGAVMEGVDDELEKEEIEEGFRFRDRDFILSVIDDFCETAPALDIWACLRRESEAIQPLVEELRREYEARHQPEREARLG